MVNAKLKAMAMLVHTFLAQAISPLFPTNMYYKSLYMWHVLGERNMTNPGQPPYYSTAFFSIIRDIHENSPLNVTWITVKQWYRILMEKEITHTCEDMNSPPSLIQSKVEVNHPEVSFPVVYQLSRKYGLSPDQKSFIFKMIQDILPTRQRLARLGKAQSPLCTLCEDQVDTLAHHLLTCPQTSEVSSPLMRCLSSYWDNITPEQVILLDMTCTESQELPVVWLISTCLKLIWEERTAGRRPRLAHCQAELKARLLILKHTRWKHYMLHNSALLLEENINLHFS